MSNRHARLRRIEKATSPAQPESQQAESCDIDTLYTVHIEHLERPIEPGDVPTFDYFAQPYRKANFPEEWIRLLYHQSSRPRCLCALCAQYRSGHGQQKPANY